MKRLIKELCIENDYIVKNNKLYISVKNIKQLDNLLNSVMKREEELRKAVNELERFYLEISFSTTVDE